MKVLFDSNVLISAAAFGGAAARAVKASTTARWKVFVSPTILRETTRVLQEKFGFSHSKARSAAEAFRHASQLTDEPLMGHHVPGDPNDTPILRAALAAGVDYLVTRDAELLALNPTDGVRIITLAEYLHILQDHGFARDC